MPVRKERCACDALPHAFHIGVFKFIFTISTAITHIYKGSANIIEGCDVACDTNDCLNFQSMVPVITIESMMTRARPSYDRNHDRLPLYPTRTGGARNVLRHHIPELLNKFPPHLVKRFKTHSLYSVSHHIKCYLIDLYSYDCDEIDCYICNNNCERKIGDSVGAVATLWSLTVARVVAITTSTASIGMRWFDMTVFPYRSSTEATIS